MGEGGLLYLQALESIEKNVREQGILAASSGPGEQGEEYLHIWPRDAVLVALELLNHDKPKAFQILSAICNLKTDGGLLFQRYEEDGEVDSKAWCNHTGKRQLDQDALKFVAASKGATFNLEELYKGFISLGGRLLVCELAFDVHDFTAEDLIEGTEVVGATTFVAEAADANLTFSF